MLVLVLTVTVIVSAQTSNDDVIKKKFEKALSQLGKDDEKVS